MKTNSLNKQQIRDVIEGRGNAGRVPILFSLWMNKSPFQEDAAACKKWLDSKVCDVDDFFLNMPDATKSPADDPNYRWAGNDIDLDETLGIDERIIIQEWDKCEEFYDTFPSAEYPELIPAVKLDHHKYILARWWYTLFERHWQLRGMENALTDFLLYPDEVHVLYDKLTDFYIRAIERAHNEAGADGVFISDDLGSQSGTMFSREIFLEFFKPRYKRIIDRAHELGMHMWLHSCGNIKPFMNDFVEIGLDVIHPIQKHTMDSEEITRLYGGKICIFAGFDVQQIIPFGTEEEVCNEVREMIDTYWREDGRFMLTMGNGATPDWKINCLDALYDEALKYGTR